MNYKRAFIKNSQVFITIVTSKRRSILINNINLLRNSFKFAKQKQPFDITAIVILPNHLHMIIKPYDTNKYPEIVKLVKTYFSKNIDENKIKDYHLSRSKMNKDEKDIWQRRYWEHSIINEQDLNTHIDYIHYNPVKHKLVKTPKDWEYSSFKKFVKDGYYEMNWYNADDKYEIMNMELE